MIEERGTVTRVNGDYAWVITERRSTCGGCAARAGCGTAVLDKVLGRQRVELRTLNGVGARVGDVVILGLREDALVRGSAVVYLVPLLAMFALALLGELLAPQLVGAKSEALVSVFGVVGLALGYGWVRVFTRKISNDGDYQPTILRRLRTAPVSITPVVSS